MNATPKLGANAATNGNDIIGALLRLIDELQQLIQAENQALRRGLPASLAGSTQRKNELADEFERWVMLIAANPALMNLRQESERQQVSARAAALNTDIAENMERLQKAMRASRARIDAIMAAIRADTAGKSPYGANARRVVPRSCNGYASSVRI